MMLGVQATMAVATSLLFIALAGFPATAGKQFPKLAAPFRKYPWVLVLLVLLVCCYFLRTHILVDL